ncbi:MAG: asparagine synthetase B [Candidatus Bathyarchaeota archaeon]|nr:asparagine synthetase B [Candidatus Termiticorpusculum sp.]
MRTTIAVLNKKGDSALPTIIEVLKNTQKEQAMNFTVAIPGKVVSHKNLNMLNIEDLNSSIVIGCSFTDEAKRAYNFLQADNVITVFEGIAYASSTAVTEENYMQELTEKLPYDVAQLQTLAGNVEGDYSALMLKDGDMAVVRDVFGAQPLYYGESKELAAFASCRRALWQLGISETLSFPSGNLCLLTKSGLQFRQVKTFSYSEPVQLSMDETAQRLQKFLEQSVRARVVGVGEVAVAFSGGLDSSLIAYIAGKCGVKVNLIHVSLENELEIETALEAAEKLDLPVHVHLFKESDVEKTLPRIVELIEEANPVKAAIGVPIYWAAQKTREVGCRVLLAGQGADELFGGYQRYVNEYCNYGAEKVQQLMFNDVVNIHENNLERDKKICIDLDVDLRLPFVSFELIELALGLPVELKFEQKQDSLRKLILRKAALNMNLPTSIVNKPKKAVQYSTGINNAIKRIAQKDGQTVKEYITGLFNEKQKDMANNNFS